MGGVEVGESSKVKVTYALVEGAAIGTRCARCMGLGAWGMVVSWSSDDFVKGKA